MIKLFDFSNKKGYMNLQEFKIKSKSWIQKPKSEWNHITVVAYFYNKYYAKHNVYFRFASWKDDPAKTKECRDFAKIIKLFLPDNYNILSKENKKASKKTAIIKTYNYINWMFDWKFKTGARSITGTRFFLIPTVLNEFERMYSKILKEKNNSARISSFKDWCLKENPEFLNLYDFSDIKDLRILYNFIESGISDKSLSKNTCEFIALKKIKKMEIL